jgi:ribose transport system ATP-binding protein
MPEVRELCGSLSIIRNGACVGSYRTTDIDDAEVFRLIMGRTLGSAYPPRPAAVPSTQAPVLNVSNICAGSRLHGISLSIRPGECVGIAALQGMGQLELFKALFGLSPATAGTIEVSGSPVTIRSPGDAIASKVGMSLVPEERKTEGLVLNLTGKANVSLPTIEQYARWGKINRHKEAQAVASALRRVGGNMRALYEAASAFSGGNQQKFVIAKWLLADSKILLLFDPTRGVDVGAKFEIYQVMRDYLSAGGAVLLHSTEIPELANMCDRILVLYAGSIVAELDARQTTDAQITTAMLGIETRSLEHADGGV